MMSYENINLYPTLRTHGQELPRTGWNRPNLDYERINEWYAHFKNWQSVLPKTDYTRYSSSVWYTHEWVPGIPVIPNMSRPPLYSSSSSETEIDSLRRRLSFSPGNMDETLPLAEHHHDVWYRWVTYTISTIIITITTTVLSVFTANEAHSNSNGFHVDEFSLSGEEDVDTVVNTQYSRKQKYWFTRMFSSVFEAVTSVFLFVCRTIMMPFKMIMVAQAYTLSRFNSLFKLNRSRRWWALILLLLVPYLFIFAWSCDTKRPSLAVEEKINIGWIYQPSDDNIDIKETLEVVIMQKERQIEELKAQFDGALRMIDQLTAMHQEQQINSKFIKAQMDKFEQSMVTKAETDSVNVKESLIAMVKEYLAKFEEAELEQRIVDREKQNLHYQQLHERNSESISTLKEQMFAIFKEFEVKLNDISLRKEDLYHHHGQVIECKGDCHDIVSMYVDADKIAIPDYALLSSGGTVISIRCSKSLKIDTAYQVLGFNVPWLSTSNPWKVLQPSIYPGECWCFEGSHGHLVIGLRSNITITSVTLEHAHKSVLAPGAFASAPYRFNVIGLNSIEEPGDILGEFSFEDNDKNVQRFDVQPTSRSYSIVELHILSNHGDEHTCVYRFRVHGSPHEAE